MSPYAAFQEALGLQDEIIREQRDPRATTDVLGRPVLPCCGALDLGPSSEGGRPYQCVCARQLTLDEAPA